MIFVQAQKSTIVKAVALHWRDWCLYFIVHDPVSGWGLCGDVTVPRDLKNRQLTNVYTIVCVLDFVCDSLLSILQVGGVVYVWCNLLSYFIMKQ